MPELESSLASVPFPEASGQLTAVALSVPDFNHHFLDLPYPLLIIC